jgi:hypothetical protein
MTVSPTKVLPSISMVCERPLVRRRVSKGLPRCGQPQLVEVLPDRVARKWLPSLI